MEVKSAAKQQSNRTPVQREQHPPLINRTMRATHYNTIVTLFSIVFCILSAVLYFSVHGVDGIINIFNNVSSPAVFMSSYFSTLAIFILTFISLNIAGMALQLAGYVCLAKHPRQSIKMGINRKSLMPYIRCNQGITARLYRLIHLVPTLIFGVIPFVVTALAGGGFIFILSVLMICVGSGDVLLVILTMDLKRTAMVMTHPKKIGCLIIGNKNNQGNEKVMFKQDDHIPGRK